MIYYPDWVDELRHRLPGETAGQHVARIVRGCDGMSLEHDKERLAELFWCNEALEEQARIVSTWKTNCGTFARQALCLAGSVSRHVCEKYVNGKAVQNVRDAGREAGAVHRGTEWRLLGPGWICVYWASGNDAHIEVCLSVPDAVGAAEHGGGGRAMNAITCGRGSVLSSLGRPLQEILDPELMCVEPARGDNPY